MTPPAECGFSCGVCGLALTMLGLAWSSSWRNVTQLWSTGPRLCVLNRRPERERYDSEGPGGRCSRKLSEFCHQSHVWLLTGGRKACAVVIPTWW